MKNLLLILLLLAAQTAFARKDNTFLKVHFLYGSTPKAQHKATESKWFGGLLGGHAGIEWQNGEKGKPNEVLHFLPSGGFHVFCNDKKPKSAIVTSEITDFWQVFGGRAKDMKKLTITIPITQDQKEQLDEISKKYQARTPYDYAFFGMRCGASTHEILAQLGIVKKYGYRKTYLKVFIPAVLRKNLLRQAEKNNWKIERQAGTERRKWERD
jgi:hypothetical protein